MEVIHRIKFNTRDELNLGGNKITNLSDPTSPTDAANKRYVDEKLPAAVSYTISAGLATWTPTNSTFKYTATITGIHRFTFFSDAGISIHVKSSSRSEESSVISVIITKGSEETLTLVPADILPMMYHWYIEFIEEIPELIN